MNSAAPELSQQTVLITGAANGLGKALANAFAAAGASLVLMDYNEQALLETARDLPRVSTYVTDLSDTESTMATIAAIRKNHPAVHTLIHNAGFLVPQSFSEMTDDRWELTFNVGIQAARLLTKAFWADWQSTGGVAIYLSSRSGLQGSFGEAPYSATKHALEGFSQVLGIEGAPNGIYVHSMTPGMYMHTPMSEQNYLPEYKAKWVDPIELTPAFLYLAMRRDKSLSGTRISAWDLSEKVRAGLS